MKYSTLLVLLFTLISRVSGQHVKYKELFPFLSSLSNEEVKNKLKEYLSDDLDHPNANFRLAYIYETNYRRADPLTDFQYAMANAEQATIRYIKSKQLVDNREVERNNEYYFPFFKTFDAKGNPYVNFTLVQQKMNNGYDSAILFNKKMPAIYQNFTRSVFHYDRATKLFADINSQYGTTEDLLLLHHSELDLKLGSLKTHYDSTLIYLDRYVELIQQYPINKHRQKYVVKPIKTYRMDGLQSRINFLVNEISLWDYGKWVDQVRLQVEKDVVGLRQKLNKQEESLNSAIATAGRISPREAFVPAVLDKQTMFALSNIDRQSLLQSLFNYKVYKQEYIRQRRQLELDTISSERNAQVYTQWIYSNRRADTLLQVVKSGITPLEVEKHKEFLGTYYKGQDGVGDLIKSEEKAIKDDFHSVTNLIQEEVRQIPKEFTGTFGKFVKIGIVNVPLFSLAHDSLVLDNTLHTSVLLKNPDGSLYAGGMYRPDKKLNNLVVFVAKITAEGKGEWFKAFNLKADSLSKDPFDNFIGPMALSKEGCAFLVHTVDATKATKLNTLIYLTEKGEDKKRKKLKEGNYPRQIIYSEASNGYIVLLKGDEQMEDTSSKEIVTLLSYNVLGDQLWKNEIPLTGNVTLLLNLSDGYAIAGNYFLITDLAGKEFKTRINEQEVNPYFIKIKNSGETSLIKPLAVSSSLVTTRVVKVTDRSIHLLGQKGGLADQSPDQGLDTHIMIDSNGQIIFSSVK